MKIKGSLNGWKVAVVLGLITLLLLLKNSLLVDGIAIIVGGLVYLAISYFLKDKQRLVEQKKSLDTINQQLTTLKNNQDQQLKTITDQQDQVTSKLENQYFSYDFPNNENLSVQTYEINDSGKQNLFVVRKVFEADKLRYRLVYSKDAHILQYWQYLTPDTYTQADFEKTPPKYEYHSNYEGTLDLNNLPSIETVNTQLQSKDWYYQQLKNKVRHQLAVIEKMNPQTSSWFLRKDTDGQWFKDHQASSSLLVAEKTSRRYFDLHPDNDLAPNNLPGLAKVEKLYSNLNVQLKHLADLKTTYFKNLKVNLPAEINNLTEHDLTALSNRFAAESAKSMVDQKLRENGKNKFIAEDVVVLLPDGKANEGTQIDNLVISDKGIFPIETEERTINSKSYNASNGYQEISKQIIEHKNAIEYTLKQSQDPVIQKLLQKPIAQYLVHSLVVFVGKSSQDFELKNTKPYLEHGAHALRLSDLQEVVSEGGDSLVAVDLTREEVKALGNELIKNSKNRTAEGRAGNLVFWNGETNENVINHTLDTVKDLTKQLEIMNDCLDHLIELQEEIDNLKVQQDAINEIKQVDTGFTHARRYYENQQKTHDYSFVDSII